MKKILTIALGCAVLAGNAWAQNRNCGTMDNLSRIENMDRGYAAIRARVEAQTQRFVDSYNPQGQEVVYNIPVVVHVIYANSTQNISDAQVASQIDVLNKDFRRLNTDAGNTPSGFASLAADCEINFCLATVDPSGNATTGITRTSTTVTSWGTNDAMKYTSSGGRNAWPASQYLNLWVCNLGGGVLGYAQFPGSGSAATDGVVIGYNYFGTTGTATAPFNKGRTATHEVGHWLNLYHIWGDDGTSCSGSDNVSDTPNQAGENYGCPSFPRLDACTPSGNGVMFMNYMDYTDDACMNMFTNGQKARMVAQLASGGQRASLATSPGCGSGGGGTSSYCASKGNSTSDEWINSVTVGSNTNTSGNNGGYGNFTSISWTLTKGTAYSVSLNQAYSGTTYAEGWAIWVDLNGDSDFADAGEQLFTSAASTSPASGSITIPTSATATTTRMRISMKYNGVPTSCETFSYGEVEDYTVVLSSGTSCGTPTSLSASSITSSSATLNWAAVSGASSYSVQYRVSGATSWTTTTSTTNSKAISGLAASTTYQFQVRAVCSGVNGSYSSIGSFTTSAAPPAGCTDSYESNNTTSTAKTISRNTTISASIGSTTDVDYYKFTTSSSTGYKVRIDLTNLPYDYDVKLYRGTTTLVGTSENGGTTSEAIIYNYTAAATYYVRVYGYNGAYSTTQCYNLLASVRSTNFREAELPDPVAKDLTLVTEDEMEVFPNPTNSQLFINYLALNGGNGSVMVMDLAGKVLINNAVEVSEGMNSFDLNMGNFADGLYIVRMQVGDKILNRKVQVAH